MQLVTSVGAHSCGEHVGAFAIAGNLAVGEISPVSAVVTVVKRGRSGMIGGVKVSVTQRFENEFFLFQR